MVASADATDGCFLITKFLGMLTDLFGVGWMVGVWAESFQ
jgi:hypothetical protein